MPSPLAEPAMSYCAPAEASATHAHDGDPDQHDGFALLRLVLGDSLSPGRIVELPLAGGAVLTG